MLYLSINVLLNLLHIEGKKKKISLAVLNIFRAISFLALESLLVLEPFMNSKSQQGPFTLLTQAYKR